MARMAVKFMFLTEILTTSANVRKKQNKEVVLQFSLMAGDFYGSIDAGR